MSEAGLRDRQTLLGCPAIPVRRLDRVARDPASLQMERGNIDLSGIALFCRLFELFRGFAQISRNALTACIKAAETKLCLGVTGYGV